MAPVAILVQTITSEFLKWTGRCCLYPFAVEWYSCCWLGTVSLTINLLIVLQPKNPRKCWGLPGLFSRCEVGDLLARVTGGPTTDHPYSLPASPDTSDAGDVVRRCPPQGMQDQQRTFNHFFSVTPNAQWFLGVKVYWLLSLIMELLLSDLGSVVMSRQDVTDRGHTDPVKNGDAFERLGII